MPKGRPNDDKMVVTWQKTGIVGLRDRGLKELPQQVAAVGEAAKTVDATNNKLSAFPSVLSQLTSLTRLTLSSNLIAALSGAALLPLAGALKILVLDDNEITSLPDEIGCLTRLERLSLKSNRLVELNPAVGRLVSLQFLIMAGNRLRALPDEVSGCEVLEELDASSNAIQLIPEALGRLQRMKTLNLDNNGVSQVPPAVFLNCAALQTLSLHGNPVVPASIAETEGYAEFEARRRGKYSKGLAGGVVFGKKGLDEGIDRTRA